MDKLEDSIATAERLVAESNAVMQAEFRAIEAKAHRVASSPLLWGGVLLVALTIGYLAIGARNNPSIAGSRKARGTWSQLLQIGQLLLPLVGAVRAVQVAKARRKVIAPTIVISENKS